MAINIPLLQYAQAPAIQLPNPMGDFSNALLQAGQMRENRQDVQQQRQMQQEQQDFQNMLALENQGMQQQRLGMEQERLGMQQQQFDAQMEQQAQQEQLKQIAADAFQKTSDIEDPFDRSAAFYQEMIGSGAQLPPELLMQFHGGLQQDMVEELKLENMQSEMNWRDQLNQAKLNEIAQQTNLAVQKARQLPLEAQMKALEGLKDAGQYHFKLAENLNKQISDIDSTIQQRENMIIKNISGAESAQDLKSIIAGMVRNNIVSTGQGNQKSPEEQTLEEKAAQGPTQFRQFVEKQYLDPLKAEKERLLNQQRAYQTHGTLLQNKYYESQGIPMAELGNMYNQQAQTTQAPTIVGDLIGGINKLVGGMNESARIEGQKDLGKRRRKSATANAAAKVANVLKANGNSGFIQPSWSYNPRTDRAGNWRPE